jgi:hypothetical protein
MASSQHPGALLDSPPIEILDHYLGMIVRFFDYHHVYISLHELSLPYRLVFAAVFFYTRRSRRPPRLPRYTQIQFHPLQLQRFLRAFVLTTARALVSPPASAFRMVLGTTKSRWMHRIFNRVMSGFVARTEVRRQEARCTCRAALTRVPSAASARKL